MSVTKYLTAVFLFILCYACDSTEPPANDVILSVEDVSCTEAWLKLTTGGITLPANAVLQQDGEDVMTLNITTPDTILYVNDLLPNKTYIFQVTGNKQPPKGETVTSNQQQLTTLDTTSHNFNWQKFEFGEHASSHLADVAIIDENNLWVVGEIFMNDSRGNIDPIAYNAVHWDGNKWELKKIPINYQGILLYPPIRSLISFDDDDIWFESGIHWNGKIFETRKMNIEFNSHVNAMWGTSSSNLYIVGNEGKIAHYNGQSWQMIESRTIENLYDIYGINESELYVGGGDIAQFKGVFLKGNKSGFKVIGEGKSIYPGEEFDPYFSGSISTVWTSNQSTVYAGGFFLYRYKYGRFEFVKSLEGNYLGGNSYAQYWGYITGIRGNGENDIFMVGERNTIRHFNGVTWRQIGMPYDPNSDILWWTSDLKNRLVVTVGRIGNKAAVMLLMR